MAKKSVQAPVVATEQQSEAVIRPQHVKAVEDFQAAMAAKMVKRTEKAEKVQTEAEKQLAELRKQVAEQKAALKAQRDAEKAAKAAAKAASEAAKAEKQAEREAAAEAKLQEKIDRLQKQLADLKADSSAYVTLPMTAVEADLINFVSEKLTLNEVEGTWVMVPVQMENEKQRVVAESLVKKGYLTSSEAGVIFTDKTFSEMKVTFEEVVENWKLMLQTSE
jgi:DNA repair exonuclease SbcCD ATPase subunit